MPLEPPPLPPVSSPPASPPVDGSAILQSLKGLVEGNKAPSGGGKSWVGTLIILAVVLAGIAIWSWVSWRQGKELAKLRHEKEKQRILAEQAMVDGVVASGKMHIIDLKKKFEEASRHLEQIDKDIATVEGQRDKDKQAIDRIRSWRDVDPGAPSPGVG